MKFDIQRDYSSGFGVHVEQSDGLPFLEAGELWAPVGWMIDWHANAGWEIYYQAKHDSQWEIGEDRASVPEYGAYLIRAGVRHRLAQRMKPDSHFLYAVFPVSVIPPTVRRAACWQGAFAIFPRAQSLQLPLQGIIRELAVRERWQSEMCTAYCASLCTGIARLSETPQVEQRVARHPAAERAMRLLQERLDYPWRLEVLARLSGVSTQHLIDIFRREYGTTPMKHLLNLRLEEAQRQLQQTGKQVTTVAHELGFASSQHLARSFKALFGETPTQARSKRS